MNNYRVSINYFDPFLISKFFATGFYSGLTKVAPGTCGTIGSLLFWYLLFNNSLLWGNLVFRVCFICGFLIIGIISTYIYLREINKTSSHSIFDPQEIVIDEWLGMFITFSLVSTPELSHLIWGFILFRFFDITKLYPINLVEKLPGAIGVMADDCVAGFMAAILINIVI
jgi:phosphatidylglycerophosphatase A